jgi:ubiquinone/menaquinone biosynthesis C-methylase UbiE
MEQHEMVTLIHDGVPAQGGLWADLGAGTGNFTWALAAVLGRAGTIYEIDPRRPRHRRTAGTDRS